MDVLIKGRGIIKSQITRIENYMIKLDSTTADEEAISERIVRLVEIYHQFEEIQKEIESHDECVNVEDQENERIVIEDKYFKAKSLGVKFIKELRKDMSDNHNPAAVQLSTADNTTELQEAIQKLMGHQTTLAELVKQIPITNDSGHESRAGPGNLEQNNGNQPDLRLQRVEIPKFDGNYKNWTEFNDLYVNLVHNNKRLSGCEKLQYLKRALVGNAQGVLRNLPISDANYVQAYDELVNTFNKKDLIIDSHLQTIMEQQKLHASSAEGLRLLCSNVNESVRALTALGVPTEHWDRWLIFVLSSKIDDESLKLWRREVSQKKETEVITFTNLVTFINNRIYEVTPGENKSISKPNVQSRGKQAFMSSISSNACFKCKGDHGVYTCPQFLSLSIKKRRDYVKEKGLCFNCLKSKHMVKECASQSGCKICKFKHNTLLHEQKVPNQKEVDKNNAVESKTVCTNAGTPDGYNTAILPTAIVQIKDINGQYQDCRILLDTGSQVNLITEKCAQRLQLKRKYAKIIINGIGSTKTEETRGKVQFQLKSKCDDYQTCGQALILKSVTSDIPAGKIGSNIFSNINLADPRYASPGKIDLIVGSDIFFEVLQNGKIDNGPDIPMAQQTKLGWVIAGKAIVTNPESHANFHTCIDINERLKTFWEIEELNVTVPNTIEEIEAEEHFVQNHSRTEQGRYVVKLPFKGNCDGLGTSYNSALSTLKAMEKRFDSDPNLKTEYSRFIKEYLELQHMIQLPTSQEKLPVEKCFYLPHHAVFKDTSSTTKLRVVFDGSRKTATGSSLNNLLMVGPTIQKDIWALLLNFRKHAIAYTADITKMYRQILVHQHDTPFQRILWRDSVNEEVREYELQTVTYGTASAPFAAVRTLKQLALDEGTDFKLGAESLLNNFYVDDLMGGSNSLEDALVVKHQLTNLLHKGGFELRKWASNSSKFLSTVSSEDRETSLSLPLREDSTIKVLGLLWQQKCDCFKFEINLDTTEIFSKRTILSEISKIYDPLGLLSPCTIVGKLIMQEIWISGSNWDDILPEMIIQKYKEFRNELRWLASLQIPRYLEITSSSKIQLVGFADASESAYAAVIYVRTETNRSVSVNLLVSKTRVAPIKQISLPRLELCAAELLAKLLIKVKSTMEFGDVEVYAFTDSTVVLAWLRAAPRKWKTYIANRTSQIIENIPYQYWRHVRSAQNAADPASRGLTASKLVNLELWWNGPQFLYSSDYNKHTTVLQNLETKLEERSGVNVCTTKAVVREDNQDLCQQYSDLQKLVSVVARCQRFVFNIKATKNKTERNIDKNLHVSEINSATTCLIKLDQRRDFNCEINLLLKGKPLKKDSNLFGFVPFLDAEGVLRVGGRIQQAPVSFNKKHPIIISKSSHLTKLIVQQIHKKYFHANQQLMMNALLMKYWIIGAKHVVKKCIHQCSTCQRYRAAGYNQLMGNLPPYRLTPGRPFANTGTDFAGPFPVRAWSGRGAKQLKCYIAVFICMATKAVHIELVSNLSTEMFLAAFQRFISRRGQCVHMYSDNGRNYVGAARKLREIDQFLRDNYEFIANKLSKDEIEWHFIPAYSPNFGGLWESAVKSLKFHLKRVMNDKVLTYEEMTTLLCQIEGILNSRPIAHDTTACDNLEPLTPGHFLTQGPIFMPPLQPTLTTMSSATRWSLVQQMQQSFWKRWSTEYLSSLQKRKKWAERTKNIKVDDIVLIKEDNMPPCHWLLGKVVGTKPGSDSLVRVVTLRTKNGLVDRSIRKLIVFMPVDEASD